MCPPGSVRPTCWTVLAILVLLLLLNKIKLLLLITKIIFLNNLLLPKKIRLLFLQIGTLTLHLDNLLRLKKPKRPLSISL